MSHFVAYILQFQEIIVYKIPPGGGGGSIASLKSIMGFIFLNLFGLLECLVMWLISMPVIKV